MKFWIGLIVINSVNSNKHGIFSHVLKVFLFLKVCGSDQVELEAMVLDSSKFYNEEYCSDFLVQSYAMKIEVLSVLYSFTVSLCNT